LYAYALFFLCTQFLVGTEQLKHLTWTVFGYMCVSGLFNNVISDYLWARSVVLTSSTVATVGLSITIPLAMVSDFVVHGNPPTALSAGGAVLVIIGFCLVNVTKEVEVDLYMYVCGGAYERVAKELMLMPAPIKRKSSELVVEDMCI
jgi:solute carrier family 35 protein F5